MLSNAEYLLALPALKLLCAKTDRYWRCLRLAQKTQNIRRLSLTIKITHDKLQIVMNSKFGGSSPRRGEGRRPRSSKLKKWNKTNQNKKQNYHNGQLEWLFSSVTVTETETKRKMRQGTWMRSRRRVQMMMQDDTGWCPPVYPDLLKVQWSANQWSQWAHSPSRPSNSGHYRYPGQGQRDLAPVRAKAYFNTIMPMDSSHSCFLA